jgi:hypothetical protein
MHGPCYHIQKIKQKRRRERRKSNCVEKIKVFCKVYILSVDFGIGRGAPYFRNLNLNVRFQWHVILSIHHSDYKFVWETIIERRWNKFLKVLTNTSKTFTLSWNVQQTEAICLKALFRNLVCFWIACFN